jgi:hypothetical protein
VRFASEKFAKRVSQHPQERALHAIEMLAAHEKTTVNMAKMSSKTKYVLKHGVVQMFDRCLKHPQQALASVLMLALKQCRRGGILVRQSFIHFFGRHWCSS